MRLGKKEAVNDPRSMMLGNFMTPTITPVSYDFDKSRYPIPLRVLGNYEWGNCVKVGQAHQIVRLERLEQKRTLPIREPHAVKAYKDEVFRQFGVRTEYPGDQHDNGLVVVHNLKNWRKVGWPLDFTSNRKSDAKTYKIAAFGELEPSDSEQLKSAIYLLHGVQFGMWLPRAVEDNLNYWDYNGETDPAWKPGSWGGHLVYSKAYDGDDFEILTWGAKVRMSRRFVARYCDEAFAVVDSWDSWKKSKTIDVAKMKKYLREIGATEVVA